MTKFMTTLFALSLSTAAFAATPDFSALDSGLELDGGHGGHGGKHACIHHAWKAAKPTAEQNTQAKALLGSVKTVVERNKDAIKADFHALMAAWAKYPVSKTEVVAAQANLQGGVAPIREAALDAKIGVLNLLSENQRLAFDESLKECVKHHHHHHPRH